MNEQKSNHLIHENSPYLLQHAGNPVDWYPWGEEALAKARSENKLLLISIGYAACHWCHVMEKECFEDQEVALMMNDHFVAVKVDREERPDIDQIYMNACFIMTGSGGWPLNVIALPDQRPVYAGTYFPKREWVYLLRTLSDLHRNGDEGILGEADEIMKRMKDTRHRGNVDENLPDDPDALRHLFRKMLTGLDFKLGGTRGTPKFPMPSHLLFLLRYAHFLQDDDASGYLTTTLDHMAFGGIYDQLGGGFSRYSVDGSWLVPHFEKMLYDNAQLITLYARAYQTYKRPLYRRIVEQTTEWIEREMTSPDGLWYSSLDADSEGAEGTYYTWTASEVDDILGKEAEKIKQYFGITREGNWEEGKNVLNTPSHQDITGEMDLLRNQLLQIRTKRIAPALDDKVITSWNGMMIKGFVHAWQATGNRKYLNTALLAGTFYRDAIEKNNGDLFRIWKNNRFSIPGFLDDYAYLVTAFIELYGSTFDIAWLKIAGRLIERIQRNFGETGSSLFRYTSKEVTQLIDTPVETTDQVIPSSNSEIANGLYRYGVITGDEKLQEQAFLMLSNMFNQLNEHPLVYGNWGLLLVDYLAKPVEIAIVGENYNVVLNELSGHYLPGALFIGGSDDTGLESLKGKFVPGKTLIYLCRGKSCLAPVERIQEVLDLIDEW